MAKVSERDYWYRVCPYCKSKKLSKVAMQHLTSCQIGSGGEFTGYLCDNCQRYMPWDKTIFIYDRAEMRRDVNRLLKFLGGKE